jgi:hypothetical protein
MSGGRILAVLVVEDSSIWYVISHLNALVNVGGGFVRWIVTPISSVGIVLDWDTPSAMSQGTLLLMHLLIMICVC